VRNWLIAATEKTWREKITLATITGVISGTARAITTKILERRRRLATTDADPRVLAPVGVMIEDKRRYVGQLRQLG